MYELPAGQFDRLLPLFDVEEPNGGRAISVIKGETLGRVLVDARDAPTNCLLALNFFNVSCPSKAVDSQWLDQAVAFLRQTQDVTLLWSQEMEARAQPPDHPTEEIGVFDFHDRRASLPLHIPEGHHLRFMDGALFERCLWRDATLTAYGATENFLRDAIGLCLMKDEEICSEAYAVFLAAGKAEIGIVTAEPYRRRGYAYLTTSHLIQHCEARGYATCWSCLQDNAGSVATARKLGYQSQRAFSLLRYPRKV